MNDEDERRDNIPLGDPLPKEDSFGYVPPPLESLPLCHEKQCNPMDLIMFKILAFQCHLDELKVDTIKLFFKSISRITPYFFLLQSSTSDNKLSRTEPIL